MIEVINLGVIAYFIRLVTFCYCYMAIGHWSRDKTKAKLN